MPSLDTIAAWAEAHPYLMTAVVWPFVLAFLTLVLKPRTPLEYARIATMKPVAFFSRLVVVLQLIGALGLDPVKVVKLLQKLISPPRIGASGLPIIDQSDPPPSSGSRIRSAARSSGVALLLAAALFTFGAFVLSGCSPKALSVLDLLARKTQCAIANQDLPNEEILRKCAIDAADAKTILDLVGESRQVAATRANQAEDRGRIAAALHCHDDAGAR